MQSFNPAQSLQAPRATAHRRWKITRTFGLEIKRKLAEESNDCLRRMRTANIGIGSASVPSRPCVAEPVHQPLLADRGTFMVVKDMAGIGVAVLYVLDLDRERRPRVARGSD